VLKQTDRIIILLSLNFIHFIFILLYFIFIHFIVLISIFFRCRLDSVSFICHISLFRYNFVLRFPVLNMAFRGGLEGSVRFVD